MRGLAGRFDILDGAAEEDTDVGFIVNAIDW